MVMLVMFNVCYVAMVTDSTSISTTDTIGTTAFTVLVNDVEGDDLTFTMTCTPVTCPFQIYNCMSL